MRKPFNIEIEYEGGNKEVYTVTANFGARCMVEERIGSPIIIMQRIAKMDIRLKDLVCIIYCCIASAGYPVSEDEIGEAFNNLDLNAAVGIAQPILLEWMPKVKAGRVPQKKTEARKSQKPKS
jgi:hypothetical protein